MFIKTTKSKGYEYLYLVESVVENGRKKFGAVPMSYL